MRQNFVIFEQLKRHIFETVMVSKTFSIAIGHKNKKAADKGGGLYAGAQRGGGADLEFYKEGR